MTPAAAFRRLTAVAAIISCGALTVAVHEQPAARVAASQPAAQEHWRDQANASRWRSATLAERRDALEVQAELALARYAYRRSVVVARLTALRRRALTVSRQHTQGVAARRPVTVPGGAS